jgi:hypothetical protein
MKKKISLILTGQLTVLLQQIFGKYNAAPTKIQFSTIAIVLGNDPLQQGDSYAYKQKIKSKEDIILYYRLCHIDANGNEEFSEILRPAK